MAIKNVEDESLKTYFDSDKAGTIFVRDLVHSRTIYDIYLTDEVEASSEYRKLVHLFTKAEPSDSINVYLGSYGGSCSGCIYLVNFIRNCRAAVNMIVMAPCYSAGSTLALCGDSLIMQPNTFLMFHNYSSSTEGKGAELIEKVINTDTWIKTYFKIHTPFLSQSEIKKIFRDQDVYVHWNDKSLKSRVTKHFEKYRKQGRIVKRDYE